MIQTNIFLDDHENKIVETFKNKWNSNKVETIRRIIREYAKLKHVDMGAAGN